MNRETSKTKNQIHFNHIPLTLSIPFLNAGMFLFTQLYMFIQYQYTVVVAYGYNIGLCDKENLCRLPSE